MLKRLSFSNALAWHMLLVLNQFICTWVFLLCSLYLSIFILILSLFSILWLPCRILQKSDSMSSLILFFSKVVLANLSLCIDFRIKQYFLGEKAGIYCKVDFSTYISIWKANGNWCFYLIADNLRTKSL